MGLARIRKRGGVAKAFEQGDTLRAVARIFDTLDMLDLLEVDGSRPPEDVTEQVLQVLRRDLLHKAVRRHAREP